MMKTLRFLMVVAVIIAAVANVGFAQANPNRPHDIALDMTKVVQSGGLTDENFNAKAEAANARVPSVEETQKATRAVTRGEKVDRMNVGTLHADKIIINGGKSVGSGTSKHGSARVSEAKPIVRKVGMGKKDKIWVAKYYVDQKTYKSDKKKFMKTNDLPESAEGNPKNLATHADLQVNLDLLPEKKGLVTHKDLDKLKKQIASGNALEKTVGFLKAGFILVLMLVVLSLVYSIWTGRSLRQMIIDLRGGD